MRVRGLRVLLVAVVGAVLVSGCTAETPANDTLPTASEGAESSEELEPLGPADFPVPDEARAQTAEGATAAIIYYLQLIGHQAGVDGNPLRQLSRDCTLCTYFADQADTDKAAGITYRGGDITVEGSTAPALIGGVAEFAFSVDQTAVTAVDANGQGLPDRSVGAVQDVSTSASLTWSSAQEAWLTTSLLFE